MGLRINTNVASLTAQRNLNSVTSRLQGNYARLSSGLRIATAADDAAGLGISERMRSQIRSYGAAGRNVQDGISYTQTAEGALNEVSNNLNRLRELAVQAANGTLTTGDRDVIETEVQAIIEEIDRIADETKFNGIEILGAVTTTDVDIQVGINATETITIGDLDMTTGLLGLNLGALTVAGDGSQAVAALTTLDTAITDVTGARGELGATQNRLNSAFASIQNVRENLSASESRIRDVDVAAETADLTRNSIMQQAATAVLAQANLQPQLALSLLG